MIEKLEKHIIGENAPGMVSLMVAPTAEQQVDKINELCDVINTIQKEREAEWFEIKEWIGLFEAVRKSVNKLETMAKNTNTVLESLVQENNIHEKQIDELQMKVEPEKCEPPVDSYTEQRKWIGCICRFWYDNPDNTTLDYLGKIQTGENGIEYYGKETYDWFPHCEPVLPTDNAIYKGGDNE